MGQNFTLLSQSTLVGCGSASLAGFALNWAIQRWRTNNKSHPIFRSANHSIQPLWMWLLSASLQSFVYPSLFAIALAYRMLTASASGDWRFGNDSRMLSDGSFDMLCMRMILYIFCGYLLRDIPSAMADPLFLAHHACCFVGIITTLETGSTGALSGVLGILSLEIGSCAFNTWSVDSVMTSFSSTFPFWPNYDNNTLTKSYVVWFTLSNIVAAFYLHKSVSVSLATGFKPFGLWAAVSGSILILVRQWESLKHIRGVVPKPTLRPLDKNL